MLFISEREINVQKSPVIAHFDKANSLQAFLAMNIPIRKYTLPNQKQGSKDLSIFKESQADKNIGIEIDL